MTHLNFPFAGFTFSGRCLSFCLKIDRNFKLKGYDRLVICNTNTIEIALGNYLSFLWNYTFMLLDRKNEHRKSKLLIQIFN